MSRRCFLFDHSRASLFRALTLSPTSSPHCTTLEGLLEGSFDAHCVLTSSIMRVCAFLNPRPIMYPRTTSDSSGAFYSFDMESYPMPSYSPFPHGGCGNPISPKPGIAARFERRAIGPPLYLRQCQKKAIVPPRSSATRL